MKIFTIPRNTPWWSATPVILSDCRIPFHIDHKRHQHPVIFLRAPESFRPTLFMHATRTNQEQLDLSYVSEIKTKFLPESCSSKSMGDLAAKKWEKEISRNQTCAKIQWKSEQEFVRGRVSERVQCESSVPSPDLYLKAKGCVHLGGSWFKIFWRFEKPGRAWQDLGASRPVGSTGPLVGLPGLPFGQ